MDYPVYVGSICILLEDLGFASRDNKMDVIPMSYCRYCLDSIYDKIFADVTPIWTLEMMFQTDILMVDRWYRQDNETFYLVGGHLNVDLYNPGSMDTLREYILETIHIAHL